VRKLPRLIEINFHKLRRELWGKSTEVAQVLGIAPQSLSRKLQEHHKLTLDELNRIALYLGKDASDFLLFKESTQLDGANYPEEVIMDAMNVAQNIRQSVKEFKESISSTFGQIMENKSEAERIEIIKALDEIMESLQNSGSKVAISLDQLLENRSEAERVEIIKALENLLQHCGLKATISPELLDQLLENRSEAERVEIIKVFGSISQDDIASGLEERSEFTNLTIDGIMLLSDNGVEIEWLKALRDSGFTNLTPDEIVRL
jgi:transcriptional regulator with XRE-family HTH domain